MLYLEGEQSITESEFISKLENLVFEKDLNGWRKNNISHLLLAGAHVNDLVSIIIPTYKRPENLRLAIDSVLNQTYPNIEVIVVDDNDPKSHFRSQTEKLMEYYSDNSKVQYLKHPRNLNGSAARNTGIAHSKGSYVGFLDDDDIYFPRKIEACVSKLLQLNCDYGGVYGGYLGWNSKTEDKSRYKAGDLTFDVLTLAYESHYLHTNTTLYRRSAILKLNGFDDAFIRLQDLEFHLRFFQDYKIGVVNEMVSQLKPTRPADSNCLVGEKLFDVKLKYLKKFKNVIDSFDYSEQRKIYDANWLGVKKTYNNDQAFFHKCKRSGVGFDLFNSSNCEN